MEGCSPISISSAQKHSYFSESVQIPLTISSKQNKSIVNKLYSKKVPSFPAFVTLKRQYF